MILKECYFRPYIINLIIPEGYILDIGRMWGQAAMIVIKRSVYDSNSPTMNHTTR